MRATLDGRLINAIRELESTFAEMRLKGVVIGGVATSLLSSPRMTHDVDMIVILDIDDAPSLISGLASHGFRPQFDGMAEFAIESRLITVTHTATNTVADIMLGCMPFEEELIQRSSKYELGDITIRLPTPEDLLILKAIASRPKDIEDIRNIVLTYPNLDRVRVKHWLKAYGEMMDSPDLWEQTKALLDE